MCQAQLGIIKYIIHKYIFFVNSLSCSLQEQNGRGKGTNAAKMFVGRRPEQKANFIVPLRNAFGYVVKSFLLAT